MKNKTLREMIFKQQLAKKVILLTRNLERKKQIHILWNGKAMMILRIHLIFSEYPMLTLRMPGETPDPFMPTPGMVVVDWKTSQVRSVSLNDNLTAAAFP